MNNDLILMMKDIPVLHFNLDTFQFEVLDLNHLPYQLRGRKGIIKMSSENCNQSEIFYVFELIAKYLAMRTLVIDRENAKKILNLLGLSQSQDMYTKRDIALTCRAVSLQDNYWLRGISEHLTWNDVNLRVNSLSDIVMQVALHGSSLTLQGNVCTPELTTQGTYAKAWKRDSDGLYLYKRGTKNNFESEIEVEVSNLLNKLGIYHVSYLPAESQNEFCCKCKCITSERYSLLTALDFFTYCKIVDLNPEIEMFKYEPVLIYQMFIIDYLFSNSDRHFQNWGFFYDCDTMQIIGCHPLFDHNNAFDSSLMFNEQGGNSQVFNKKTMVEVAKWSLTKVNFSIPNDLTIKDFINEEHYKSFIFKARNLGLI